LIRPETPWFKLVVLLLVGLILMLRGADRFWHPQFWFEDGRVFFQDAYNLSFWQSVTKPYVVDWLGTGYYMLANRVLAELALVVDVEYAPAMFMILAFAVATLCCSFFMLEGFSWLMPSARLRALVCFMLALLPGSSEIALRFLNLQWYLGLLCFLLTLMDVPRTRRGAFVYLAGWLLCGLSAPQTVVFLPCLIVRAWLVPNQRRLLAGASLAGLCGLVPTFWFNAAHGAASRPEPWSVLVASFNTFAARVLVTFSVGSARSWGWFYNKPTADYLYLWYLPFATFVVALSIAWSRQRRYGRLSLLAYFVYCIVAPIILACIRQPQVVAIGRSIRTSWGGDRYFVLPVASLGVLLFWWTTTIQGGIRRIYAVRIALIAIIAFAASTDFFDPFEVTDQQWHSQVLRIKAAEASGAEQVVRVPSNPSSDFGALLEFHSAAPPPALTTERRDGAIGYAGSDRTPNGPVTTDDILLVNGWAVNVASNAPFEEVLVADKASSTVLARTRLHGARLDVAQVMADDRLRWSGWRVAVRADRLGEGRHVLRAYTCDRCEDSGAKAYLLGGEATVDIAAGALSTHPKETAAGVIAHVGATGHPMTAFRTGDTIEMVGWALNKARSAPADSVMLIDDESGLFIASTRTGNQPGVAWASDNIGPANAGWKVSFPANQLAEGRHRIRLYIFDSPTRQLLPTDSAAALEVRPDSEGDRSRVLFHPDTIRGAE